MVIENAHDCCIGPRAQRRWEPLAMRTVGDGPPMVLLHGLLGSNRYWGGAFDRLSEARRLLVPDLLGFGASPRPLAGYGPDDHGRSLVGTLERARVTEPAIVVGHSLGALLAIWMAYRYPALVRGVIAFSPPLFRDRQHARRWSARVGGVERLFALENGVTTWIARTACENLCAARPRLARRLFSMLRPELPQVVVEDATHHSWTSYSESMKRVVLAAEGAEWLASSSAPILLVAGERDRCLDLAFLRELAVSNPHVRLEVWPDERHDLPLTRPDRCLSTIGSWACGADLRRNANR